MRQRGQVREEEPQPQPEKKRRRKLKRMIEFESRFPSTVATASENGEEKKIGHCDEVKLRPTPTIHGRHHVQTLQA